jgi:hypothetical protein
MTRKIMEKINKKIDKLTNDLREMNDFVRKFQDSSEVMLFWDIENARIPVNKSGYELVSIIESYIESIYPDKKIVIKCYFEEKGLNDKRKMELNDAGCHLHLVPNPYKKKERADMVIIRDLLNSNDQSIVGLISSDGDFKPYLNQVKSKVNDVFVITNNEKYNDFLPNVITWDDICNELN